MNTLNTENMEVLIIDDETDICYLLGGLLRKKQIKSWSVNSLREAANMLKKNDPKVIFLDNHLPDGLGVNFISYIKQFHPLSKIVMITAHDTQADKQKAFKAGVDYFIGKPFSTEIVNRIIDNIG